MSQRSHSLPGQYSWIETKCSRTGDWEDFVYISEQPHGCPGAEEGVSGVPRALCVLTAFSSSGFFLRGSLCTKAASLPPQAFAILMIIGLYLLLNQSVPVQHSLAQINHSFFYSKQCSSDPSQLTLRCLDEETNITPESITFGRRDVLR